MCAHDSCLIWWVFGHPGLRTPSGIRGPAHGPALYPVPWHTPAPQRCGSPLMDIELQVRVRLSVLQGYPTRGKGGAVPYSLTFCTACACGWATA